MLLLLLPIEFVFRVHGVRTVYAIYGRFIDVLSTQAIITRSLILVD